MADFRKMVVDCDKYVVIDGTPIMVKKGCFTYNGKSINMINDNVENQFLDLFNETVDFFSIDDLASHGCFVPKTNLFESQKDFYECKELCRDYDDTLYLQIDHDWKVGIPYLMKNFNISVDF